MKFSHYDILVLLCLLMGPAAVLSQVQGALLYNPTPLEKCPTFDETTAIHETIQQVIERDYLTIGTFQNPATSCKYIPQGSPSGYYWIQPSDGLNATEQYCDTNRTCGCNSTGGWMRIANLKMTDPNQQCYTGFLEITTPRRTCGRPANFSGCVSTTFPSHGVEYSHVCGRVRAYQFGEPDAFLHYTEFGQTTIDSIYLDGVSLTHGSSPRNHIILWSFVAALDETRSHPDVCPCTRPDRTFTGTVPPFVGEDYFCETGSRNIFEFQFYLEDPLWDGQGCGAVSTCCNHPLYFCSNSHNQLQTTLSSGCVVVI